MKKKKISLPVMTFIMGVLIGIAPLAFLSFKWSSDTRLPPGLTEIKPGDANNLYTNHSDITGTSFTPLKGFYLDILQFYAMKELANVNTTLSGFRIYLGKESKTNDRNGIVGIVVGVDSHGKDACLSTDKIYKTSSMKSGPCPYMCDETSQITHQ